MSELDVSGPQLGKVNEHFKASADNKAVGVGDAERKAREKPPLSQTDGRVARGKGKNVPLNFRVTQSMKQRFLDAADRHDITMTQVLDLAMAALEAAEKGKK